MNAPFEVALEEYEIREPEGREVLVEARYSTMSPGTEAQIIAGRLMPLPVDLGYSLAGVVAAVGPEVRSLKVGDAVVATARHASMQLLDEAALIPVPTGVALDQAAFFNLGHTALYAVRRADIQIGQPVLILGQGLLGLMAMQFAKLAGAAPIVCVDISKPRLELSKTLGADCVIDHSTGEHVLGDALQQLGISTFPVVIEATGQRAPLGTAFDWIAERGRIVLMSTIRGGALPDFGEKLMQKGVNLIGGYVNSKPFSLKRSDLNIEDVWPPEYVEQQQWTHVPGLWSSCDDIAVFLNLLQYRRIHLEPLVTHRFKSSEIPDAYALVNDNSGDLIGGVIEWT